MQRSWLGIFISCLASFAGSAVEPGALNAWLRDQDQAVQALAWDVGGQFRLRYELRENAGAFSSRDFIARGQDNSDDYLLFRNLVHLGYTPAPWLTAFVEARDSRALFDKRDPAPDNDEFDLHQAFLVLGDARQFPITAKIGRQELLYGDERFVGLADWSNTRRAFDAARLRFENDRLRLDVFGGRVVIPYDDHFNVANDYDFFSGVYLSSSSLVPWQDTELFFLARNVTDQSPRAITPTLGGPGARDIYTPGLRIRSLATKLRGWDYGMEVAGQLGSINSGGSRISHRALAGNILLGYTWTNASASPRFGVEYTYATGDSNARDNKHETFEQLFGTNHRLYGAMDLFGLRNMHIPAVSLALKPVLQLSLRAEYLLFWLADTHDSLYPESGTARTGNGYGIHPRFHSFVGSEFDLIGSYQPAKWAELQCGYGHFFVSDYIRQSIESVPTNGGAVDADWVYVQLKVTF